MQFWLLEPYLTPISFLSFSHTSPHSIFMILSRLFSVVRLFVFWESLSFTRIICTTMSLNLSSGAWWVSQWDPTEDSVFAFPRIYKYPVVHQEGWGPINSTLIQGWLLIGPGLCRPISGKHSWSWLVGFALLRKQHFVTFLYIFQILRSSHPHRLLWCSLSLRGLECWQFFMFRMEDSALTHYQHLKQSCVFVFIMVHCVKKLF